MLALNPLTAEGIYNYIWPNPGFSIIWKFNLWWGKTQMIYPVHWMAKFIKTNWCIVIAGVIGRRLAFGWNKLVFGWNKLVHSVGPQWRAVCAGEAPWQRCILQYQCHDGPPEVISIHTLCELLVQTSPLYNPTERLFLKYGLSRVVWLSRFARFRTTRTNCTWA